MMEGVGPPKWLSIAQWKGIKATEKGRLFWTRTNPEEFLYRRVCV